MLFPLSATFQLDDIKKCINLRTLETKLTALPTTLDDNYDRMLSSIDPEMMLNAQKILSWLCYAFRPPTLNELVEVLAVDTAAGRFDPLMRTLNPKDVIKICGSLVSTTEAGHIVKFSHHTVREYLTSERMLSRSQARYHVTPQAADYLIATTCLTYLQGHKFSGHEEAMQASNEHPLLPYSINFWSEHFSRASSTQKLTTLALDLFDQSDHSFLSWVGLSGIVPAGLYVEQPRLRSLTKANTPNILLYYASLIGSIELVDIMLARGANINCEGGVYGTPLIMAAYKGNTEIVQALIDRGADVNIEFGYHGTALKAVSSPLSYKPIAISLAVVLHHKATGFPTYEHICYGCSAWLSISLFSEVLLTMFYFRLLFMDAPTLSSFFYHKVQTSIHVAVGIIQRFALQCLVHDISMAQSNFS